MRSLIDSIVMLARAIPWPVALGAVVLCAYCLEILVKELKRTERKSEKAWLVTCILILVTLLPFFIFTFGTPFLRD